MRTMNSPHFVAVTPGDQRRAEVAEVQANLSAKEQNDRARRSFWPTI